MSLLTTAKILSIIMNVLNAGQYILSKISTLFRNKKIKKKYKEAEEIVDDGKVDDINEILR